jgi:hypothetical protein
MVFCTSGNTGVNILNIGIYNMLYTYITSSLLQINKKQNIQSHHTPTYKMHYMYIKHETRGSFIQVRYSPYPDWILYKRSKYIHLSIQRSQEIKVHAWNKQKFGGQVCRCYPKMGLQYSHTLL